MYSRKFLLWHEYPSVLYTLLADSSLNKLWLNTRSIQGTAVSHALIKIQHLVLARVIFDAHAAGSAY